MSLLFSKEEYAGSTNIVGFHILSHSFLHGLKRPGSMSIHVASNWDRSHVSLRSNFQYFLRMLCYVIFPSFYPHDTSSWGNLHHSAVDNNFFLFTSISMLVVTTKVLSFFVTAGNSRNLTPHSTCRSLPTFQDVLVHVWRCFFLLKRYLSRNRFSYQICW